VLEEENIVVNRGSAGTAAIHDCSVARVVRTGMVLNQWCTRNDGNVSVSPAAEKRRTAFNTRFYGPRVRDKYIESMAQNGSRADGEPSTRSNYE